MANIIRIGGAGSNFKKILSGGVVSTSSAYATATFENISSYRYVLVRVYDTVDDTDYEGMAVFDISKIGNSKNFAMTVHRDVWCRITPTSIGTVDYSGSYFNIYADVYVTNDEILS